MSLKEKHRGSVGFLTAKSEFYIICSHSAQFSNAPEKFHVQYELQNITQGCWRDGLEVKVLAAFAEDPHHMVSIKQLKTD